jgi:DNA (cytosine-5)-methyltransferase 1
MIDQWIEEGIGNASEWVLIGGPPCQAYSVAGRSRRSRENQELFESDEKHFLYIEYLRIVRQFRPTIFVMENVKGILTSKNGGSLIFDSILDDLSSPASDLSYTIRSFVVSETENPAPHEFIIQSECFGIPQARHRVILFGIRSDLPLSLEQSTLQCEKKVTVAQVLSDLPRLRSRLSREPDSLFAWLSVLHEAKQILQRQRDDLSETMGDSIHIQAAPDSTGAAFIPWKNSPKHMPENLLDWYLDSRIGGVIQHESRSHMRTDLYRYYFASSFAKRYRYSPKLQDFPGELLPMHGNLDHESVPFVDRFRVQLENSCSTTVVAHIAKDGHYYIHPDPSQCRSLTVREAARLQTFPDNYFFEGNRTQQYIQIGNAVPPLLAAKIAEIVYRVIESCRAMKSPRQVLYR